MLKFGCYPVCLLCPCPGLMFPSDSEAGAEASTEAVVFALGFLFNLWAGRPEKCLRCPLLASVQCCLLYWTSMLSKGTPRLLLTLGRDGMELAF